MSTGYSTCLVNPGIAQCDTDAIATGAISGNKITLSTITGGIIAYDTIKEVNLNGAKFTGNVVSITTTLTHNLGSTPTYVWVVPKGGYTNTGVINLISYGSTFAFVQVQGGGNNTCTVEGYALL